MRISNGQIEKMLEVQLKCAQRASAAKDVPKAAKRDRVTLSRWAAQVTRAKQLAAGAPEMREDTVAAIRDRPERGEYRVPAEALADKILSEARLAQLLREL
jgi:flagellar biosynthesis anti-sigma factor FlgM